jgi:general secretion pathway protein L
LINTGRSAINWLVEGLMQAWAAVEDRLWPRRRILLVQTAEGYTLHRPDGQAAVERLQLGGSAADFPPQAATVVKDGDVDVVLPVEELLVRALDPLPAQSKPYLDGIVRHQLERLTPWRASDVLYSYHAAPAGPEDSRLMVTIAATARSLHRRRLEQLAALQPRHIRLVFRDGLEGQDVAIDVSGDSAAMLREQRMRRAIGWSAVGLTTASVLAVVLLVLVWQRTEATLETVEREVADLRGKLTATGPVISLADRDVASIFNRRLSTPVAVVALDALSASLPDDTWLSEFRMAEGRIRMSGVSRSVSRLVPLLEASPSFAEATFFAPTTRLPNNQGDRFHLDAKLVPPGTPKS